jgi:acetate kinase
MGSSSSKTIVVEKCSHSSGCQCAIVDIEKKERAIKQEISQQQPLITQNVRQQLEYHEDVLLLKYSDLKNRSQIISHLEKIFKGDNNVMKFLKEQATKMIAVFQDSAEMKQLSRWNSVKKVF